MAPANLERVSEWKSVTAAVLYLATFLATAFGLYALTRGASFIESFAIAYPIALVACGLLFLCSAVVESIANLAKARTATKRVTLQSLVHR